MKYSYNWLKELSDTKSTPEKAAELLTMKSMEVEGVEKISGVPNEVVVGKILEIKKHPNADKLQLTRIDVRDKKLDIVCGAWNIKVGDIVPVALVGAKLPNGLEIKEAEIRGEKSFGMLCAEDELGLGEDHSGIIILTQSAKIGEPVSKYLGGSDTAIEIKVLPDRAHDSLSHVGVAREVAALEGRKFNYDFEGLKLAGKKSKVLSVDIKDRKLCSRYIGAVMTDVEIGPSPVWMRERLKVCGIKAINNVVDATNYVMLELGQPLHAFDFSKIKSEFPIKSQKPNDKCQIIIRRARKDERMVLLDDSEIKLSENDLLITNGEKPLALAGIMGGKDSGINENTKTIVLEAASFSAVNIRRTRTRLGVKTESSDRFEKDIDSNLAEKAMVRVIEILERTADGRLEGIMDVYPEPIKPWKVKLNLDYANNLLGEKVPANNIKKILTLLGFKVNGGGKIIAVEVPTFRRDVLTQEDLIEEIGRIWGYDKIDPQPLMELVEPAHINEQVFLERKIRSILRGAGFDEIYNYSFYSKRDAEICGFNDTKHYELANPMNPEQELVRLSLAPNVLRNIRENLKHFEGFDIFEIGRVYYPSNGKMKEKRMLAMASVLDKDSYSETFYCLKGALGNLLESLNIRSVRFDSLGDKCPSIAHSGRCAEIKIDSETIGIIAEFNPSILPQYKIKKRVAMVELDLEKLLRIVPKTITYQPIGKFPIISRDISMIVPKNVTYAEIKDLIIKIGGSLINKVELFDRFEAKQSLAIRIFMSAENRTLESKEAEEATEKIIAGLEKEFGIEVRK